MSHRCIPSVRVLSWLAAFALALAVVGLAPASARAGTERSGYVHLSPGAVHLPIGPTEHNRVSKIGYHWGLGAGGQFDAGRLFRMQVGLGFEHALHRRNDDAYRRCAEFDCRAGGQLFRVAPQLRLGLGRTVFGYAFAEPGLAIRYDAGRYERGSRNLDFGFGVGAGLGLQVKVWERLFLGVEVGPDFAWLGRPAIELDGKVLIGWAF